MSSKSLNKNYAILSLAFVSFHFAYGAPHSNSAANKGAGEFNEQDCVAEMTREAAGPLAALNQKLQLKSSAGDGVKQPSIRELYDGFVADIEKTFPNSDQKNAALSNYVMQQLLQQSMARAHAECLSNIEAQFSASKQTPTSCQSKSLNEYQELMTSEAKKTGFLNEAQVAKESASLQARISEMGKQLSASYSPISAYRNASNNSWNLSKALDEGKLPKNFANEQMQFLFPDAYSQYLSSEDDFPIFMGDLVALKVPDAQGNVGLRYVSLNKVRQWESADPNGLGALTKGFSALQDNFGQPGLAKQNKEQAATLLGKLAQLDTSKISDPDQKNYVSGLKRMYEGPLSIIKQKSETSTLEDKRAIADKSLGGRAKIGLGLLMIGMDLKDVAQLRKSAGLLKAGENLLGTGVSYFVPAFSYLNASSNMNKATSLGDYCRALNERGGAVQNAWEQVKTQGYMGAMFRVAGSFKRTQKLAHLAGIGGAVMGIGGSYGNLDKINKEYSSKSAAHATLLKKFDQARVKAMENPGDQRAQAELAEVTQEAIASDKALQDLASQRKTAMQDVGGQVLTLPQSFTTHKNFRDHIVATDSAVVGRKNRRTQDALSAIGVAKLPGEISPAHDPTSEVSLISRGFTPEQAKTIAPIAQQAGMPEKAMANFFESITPKGKNRKISDIPPEKLQTAIQDAAFTHLNGNAVEARKVANSTDLRASTKSHTDSVIENSLGTFGSLGKKLVGPNKSRSDKPSEEPVVIGESFSTKAMRDLLNAEVDHGISPHRYPKPSVPDVIKHEVFDQNGQIKSAFAAARDRSIEAALRLPPNSLPPVPKEKTVKVAESDGSTSTRTPGEVARDVQRERDIILSNARGLNYGVPSAVEAKYIGNIKKNAGLSADNTSASALLAKAREAVAPSEGRANLKAREVGEILETFSRVNQVKFKDEAISNPEIYAKAIAVGLNTKGATNQDVVSALNVLDLTHPKTLKKKTVSEVTQDMKKLMSKNSSDRREEFYASVKGLEKNLSDHNGHYAFGQTEGRALVSGALSKVRVPNEKLRTSEMLKFDSPEQAQEVRQGYERFLNDPLVSQFISRGGIDPIAFRDLYVARSYVNRQRLDPHNQTLVEFRTLVDPMAKNPLDVEGVNGFGRLSVAVAKDSQAHPGEDPLLRQNEIISKWKLPEVEVNLLRDDKGLREKFDELAFNEFASTRRPASKDSPGNKEIAAKLEKKLRAEFDGIKKNDPSRHDELLRKVAKEDPEFNKRAKEESDQAALSLCECTGSCPVKKH